MQTISRRDVHHHRPPCTSSHHALTRPARTPPRHTRRPQALRLAASAEPQSPIAAREQAVDAKLSLLLPDPESAFSIAPEELIVLCKEYLAAELGALNPDLMSDDFAAMLPVIGPLSKEAFVKVFGGFKIKESFPDFQENFFGFTVDPAQPNRVWFMARGKGTNTEPLWNGLEATNKVVEITPTISSVIFNESGKVVKLTTGYPMDREEGNTGGMSAAFGIIHAVKPGFLPFPEAQPYKPSWQFWLAQKIGVLGGRVVGSLGNGEAKSAGSQPLVSHLTVPYGALLTLGGLMGAVLKGSMKSLMMGGGSGIVMIALGLLSTRLWKAGKSVKPVFMLCQVLTGALAFMMGKRFLLTSASFFPAGFIALVSAIMLSLYTLSVLRGADPLKVQTA